MAGVVEYPPAVIVHQRTCVDVPMAYRGAVELTPVIAARHPNAVAHGCFHPLTHHTGLIESRYYPPHHYRPSSHWPHDAPVPLCRTCRGTHTGEQRSAIETVSATALLAVARSDTPAGQLLLPDTLGRNY